MLNIDDGFFDGFRLCKSPFFILFLFIFVYFFYNKSNTFHFLLFLFSFSFVKTHNLWVYVQICICISSSQNMLSIESLHLYINYMQWNRFPNGTGCAVVAPLTVASAGRHGWSNLIACLSLQGEDIVPVCLVAAVFGLVGQQVKGKTPSSQFYQFSLKLETKPPWL